MKFYKIAFLTLLIFSVSDFASANPAEIERGHREECERLSKLIIYLSRSDGNPRENERLMRDLSRTLLYKSNATQVLVLLNVHERLNCNPHELISPYFKTVPLPAINKTR